MTYQIISVKKQETVDPKDGIVTQSELIVHNQAKIEFSAESPVGKEIIPESEDQQANIPLFQAIGTLYGLPERDGEGNFSIVVEGQRYHLFILGDRYRAWLTQLEKQPDQPLYLRVYPKYLNLPKQDPIVSFQVTAWENKPLEEESGLFRLRGVWQFVPQMRIPVISIYRNQGVSDPKGKFKATHLPVMMRREDGVDPFRFNPKVAKEELPKRYFIQAIFKFIPSRNCWGWVEDLEPPTELIPKYEKPVKAVACAKRACGIANQQAEKRTETGTGLKKIISSKRVNEIRKKEAIVPKSKPLIRRKISS